MVVSNDAGLDVATENEKQSFPINGR